MSRKDKNISLILPGLYQGNYYGAIDKEKLDLLNISAILNCGCNNYKTEKIYLKIEMEDSMNEDLLEILPKATLFIHNNLSSGRNVYVHCKGGFSRSTSVVIGYLMKYKDFTLKKALEFVKDQNPRTKPNMGFMIQLQAYSDKLNLINKID